MCLQAIVLMVLGINSRGYQYYRVWNSQVYMLIPKVLLTLKICNKFNIKHKISKNLHYSRNRINLS